MSIETRPVARAKLIEACVAPKSILAARCLLLLQIFSAETVLRVAQTSRFRVAESRLLAH
jgi:hypothetical protein